MYVYVFLCHMSSHAESSQVNLPVGVEVVVNIRLSVEEEEQN